MAGLIPASSDNALLPSQDSLQANGTAAAPAAAAAFVSLAAPPAGVYRITGSYLISGAVEASPQNVALNANNAQQTRLPDAGGITDLVPFTVDRITLNGTNVVSLTAVANATAATVYTGNIVVTRLA